MRFFTFIAFTLIAAFAAASPAHAQKLSGMGANIYGNYFNFAKANLQSAPVSSIKAGPLTVKLQTTKLAEVQKRFGGDILRAGGTEGVSWLCYHTGEANVWFLSNSLGGQEFVMMVAVEASTRQPGDCISAPEGFALPNLGIPGIGASTADLKAAFGAASGSKIAYRHDRPTGYTDIAQYIGYMMKSGKVAGVGVGEGSVPTAH
jgi:hypothetical protein